jgi:uncharacterized coiled-coil protein SlyX
VEEIEARLEDQDRLISSLQEVVKAKDMVIDALEEERSISDVRFAY